MTDEEAVLRRCAEEARRLIAELDRVGLGHTPSALHMALAADDLERRSGAAPGDAVYLVEGDDHLDDPAWGVSPLVTGCADEVLRWLRERPDLERLSVVTAANEVFWAREYLERAAG